MSVHSPAICVCVRACVRVHVCVCVCPSHCGPVVVKIGIISCSTVPLLQNLNSVTEVGRVRLVFSQLGDRQTCSASVV